MTGVGRPDWRLVEFPDGDVVLRGRLYEHPGGARPAVVMAHGFTATISGMVADRYADAIHAAGLNALLYDHRGFGLSGGEPRQVLNRWSQLAGYRAALDFAATLPSVDATRLAVWGDSYSAAVAIGVAAFDDRVRALVVQVPACGRTPPPDDPDGSAFRGLRAFYLTGGPSGPPRESIGPMAVVSHDQIGSPSLLEPITAFRWFIDYGARPGTGWLNRATLEVSDTPVAFHAGLCAARLRAASLWAIAGDDEMPGAEPAVARAAFAAAPEPKELLSIDGGHFGLLYHPSPLFDRVSAGQADFLVRHL